MWALSPPTKPPRQSRKLRKMANPFLKKKFLRGKIKKYLSFKSRTTATPLALHPPRASKGRESPGKFSVMQLLQTYANTFLVSSPVLAINSKQYAWIRGPISTRMQSVFSSRQQSAEI